jgi:hypothetical protein
MFTSTTVRLVSFFSLLFTFAHAGFAADETSPSSPQIEIFMPSPCLSCIDWGAYLAENGFKVVYTETQNMHKLKKYLNVPSALESTHTARINGYFVEGHAHAEDIYELIKEKPKARGITVPGLPRSAPGRGQSSPTCETGCTVLDNNNEREVRRELYETLLVKPDGSTKIWARH